MIVLVGYGINDNSCSVMENVDWMSFYSDCKPLNQRLLAIRNQ